MVIRINIESWVIGKDGTKRRGRKSSGWVGEEVWELMGFFGPCACLGVFLLL
jgi:hypothetical protein